MTEINMHVWKKRHYSTNQQSNLTQEEFIYFASHPLRNPF